MIIKTKIKGKEVEINIPESEYWIKRNNQKVSPYWTNADNLEKRMNKEFQKAYKELEKEMYTFVGKFGTDNKLTYSQNRIIQLMKEIKPHIDDLYDLHQETLTKLLLDTYKDNYYKGLYMLSEGSKIYSSFVGLNETAIRTAISFPWSGENFSDRIYNNKTKVIQTLRSEITSSIIRGDSATTTIKAVQNRLDISRVNAGRLIQTETAAVISASDKKVYDDWGVDEFQFVATLDDRTSPICRELDGQVFKVDDYTPGLNAPVLHPFERSTTVPYFSDSTGKRIAKNLNSGKVEWIDRDINYKEWENSYID